MVQTCPNCGSPNREGYRFCSTCGARLDAPEAAQPDQVGDASATPQYTVQSWEEKVVSDPASNVAGGPAVPETPAYPARSVPSPPPPYASTAAGYEARDMPPVEADRKGEATYAPYTESAARHIESGPANRSWLVPVIVVSGLLLVLLAGMAIFLFFSPNNVTVSSPDSRGGLAAVPTPTQTCPMPQNPTPEDEVKHVVCVSNEEQIKALKELNTEILKGSRTGSALNENIELVEQLKQKRLYGEPVNLQLDILAVQVDGDKATIKTYEVWTVTFYKLDDSTVVQTRGPDKYNETYHLVKQDGKWLIESVDFVPLTPSPGD